MRGKGRTSAVIAVASGLAGLGGAALVAVAASPAVASSPAPTVTAFAVPASDYSGTSPQTASALIAAPDGKGELFAVDQQPGDEVIEMSPSGQFGSPATLSAGSGPETHPAVAASSDDGLVWLLTDDGGLYAISAGGTPTFVTTPAGDGRDMTVGPDGHLYISDNGGRVVQCQVTSAAALAAPCTGFDAPSGVAPDAIASAGGVLWLSDDNAVLRSMSTTGTFTPFPSTFSASTAAHSLTDDAGTLYSVTTTGEQVSTGIAAINPSTSVVTTYGTSAGLPAGGNPQTITTGPDGNIWFTDTGTGAIGELDPTDGAITEYPLPSGFKLGSGADAIEPGPVTSTGAQTLYFAAATTSGAPAVGVVTLPSTSATTGTTTTGTTTTGTTTTGSTTPAKLVLRGSDVSVSSAGVAAVKLSCVGAAGTSCSGKLTITASVKVKVRSHGRTKTEAKTETLGAARYQLGASRSEAVTVRLSRSAVALVGAAHGRKLGADIVARASSGSSLSKRITLVGQRSRTRRG